MATLFVATSVADHADARTRRHRQHHRVVQKDDEGRRPYAAIVVDVNSGKVMQEANADAPRHPASLTKMMTLYLLFERLEAGKIKLSTDLPVSEHAADQAPSKLNLKPGQTIAVEDAIKAIVTKSANDVAVVVAEALGGGETDFARMMTAKARELGMTQTYYRNASGLPDERQITTARDQAILARALQDRFPKYFAYFSTRTFVYRGKAMRNHNHLLGRVTGVDGIKTGYIRDSGFNIVTSVRRGPHRIVAVVFGGPSAGWRDARVRGLIEANINHASVKRTAPMVVEGWQNAPKFASAPPLPTPAPAQAKAVADVAPAGADAPIKPNPVKTVTVAPGTVNATMFAAALPSDSRKLDPPPARPEKVTTLSAIKRTDPPALPPMPPAKPDELAAHPAKATAEKDAKAEKEQSDEKSPAAKPRGPYLIQVGAFDDESDAKQRLAAAQSKASALLAHADPFTEKAAKGDKSIYRARFAGLETAQAEAACKNLKRSEIPCFLLKD